MGTETASTDAESRNFYYDSMAPLWDVVAEFRGESARLEREAAELRGRADRLERAAMEIASGVEHCRTFPQVNSERTSRS
jgi:hypothetical protein